MEALDCILTRRSASRLVDPAPRGSALDELLRAAVAAPDHGLLRPWRFLVIRGGALERLGAVFAGARHPRTGDPGGPVAATKPLRAPLIVAVISSPKPNAKIPVAEQLASAACAAYGICLAAHALGFAAMWRTGWYGDAVEVRAHLGLTEEETVTAWIYLGTPPPGFVPAPRAPVEATSLTTELPGDVAPSG
jgi:nitroreductase